MKFKCWLFGHKWGFPMYMLDVNRVISSSDYKCTCCDKVREHSDLANNGNPITGGGWRVSYK